MSAGNALRLALIGFGEAGGCLARDLAARPEVASVTAYDILLHGPDAPAMRARAGAMSVDCDDDLADAIDGAHLVICAVTASAALDAAQAASAHLSEGQIYFDVNSVSPETKRRAADIVGAAGGRYVEAAVMGAVPPKGLAVPMLLGGAHASDAKALLDPLGMQLQIAAAEIGHASAIKMTRSIMIKGIEALAVECALTAEHYGTSAEVLASLDQTFPGLEWEQLLGYLVSRVMLHGQRRADEMREVAATIAATGLQPLMATATADRQEWVARRGLRDAVGKDAPHDFRRLAAAIRDRMDD
ncbi:DUF1932 domain-containing protein [Marinibaculum pumilum]|uniref:DUF1932 domain-containing protein n=1 Tax=Marinibaculum pumilum TaxID=1766165 RepID=A0ABV7L4E9_9PROT